MYYLLIPNCQLHLYKLFEEQVDNIN
jgi:hypothetical protein